MNKKSSKAGRKCGPASRAAPTVFASLSPAIPTVVFNTFWHFAVARQEIFFRRWTGAPAPWSTDPILQAFKFTNAYRVLDRVSQYLVKDVIYSGKYSAEDMFFRILLFKLFNKIETWKLLETELGEIRWNSYSYKTYEKILSGAMKSGVRIYSAAYIMASGHKLFSVEKKHQGHLRLIEMMMSDGLPGRLSECRSMRQGFELLRGYPLIGDFLGYQLITDLNYSELTSFTEMEFTMPGPGARDGIRKCFSSLGGLSEADVIRLMADRQEYEFQRLGLKFQSLWGRRLQLIDIQNLFCEVDKYSRVFHPEFSGASGRMRIKQKFAKTDSPIRYGFPPKWNLRAPRQGMDKSSKQPAQVRLL